VLGDMGHALGDAVDVGEERLGDDGDPHMYTIKPALVRKAAFSGPESKL
jgi:hypothetical protein